MSRHLHDKPPWLRDQKFMILAKAQSIGSKIVCAGCGNKLQAQYLEVDHIRPVSTGGSDDIENAILLCGPCNKIKRTEHTLESLRKRLYAKEHMIDESSAIWAERAARNAALHASESPNDLYIRALRDSPRRASAWVDPNRNDNDI